MSLWRHTKTATLTVAVFLLTSVSASAEDITEQAPAQNADRIVSVTATEIVAVYSTTIRRTRQTATAWFKVEHPASAERNGRRHRTWRQIYARFDCAQYRWMLLRSIDYDAAEHELRRRTYGNANYQSARKPSIIKVREYVCRGWQKDSDDGTKYNM